MPVEAYRHERDHDLERELLDVAFRDAGAEARPFMRLVSEGLKSGDNLYGLRFLGRDNLAEGQEEATDGGCYAILELERLREQVGDDDWQHLKMHAIACLLAAYNLHLAVGRFAAVRDGVET